MLTPRWFIDSFLNISLETLELHRISTGVPDVKRSVSHQNPLRGSLYWPHTPTMSSMMFCWVVLTVNTVQGRPAMASRHRERRHDVIPL